MLNSTRFRREIDVSNRKGNKKKTKEETRAAAASRPATVVRQSSHQRLPVHDGPVREPWPRLQPRGHYIAALSIDALKIHPTEKTDGAADLVGESMSKLEAFFVCLFFFFLWSRWGTFKCLAGIRAEREAALLIRSLVIRCRDGDY